MSPCVVEGPVAKFAAREGVPLLDESIMDAFSSLNRPSIGWSHLADTVVEAFTRQKQFQFFESNHPMLEVVLFTGEPTVWILASTPTPKGLSRPVRRRLQSQFPPSSPIQTEPPADRTYTPLPMSRSPVQAARNESMELSPTAREYGRLLQKETSCSSTKRESIDFFLQKRVSFRDLLSSTPHF